MAKRPTPSITAPKGFYAAGGTCGIKVSGHPDLALIVSDRACATAGVFSRSRTPGAPLIVTRRHLKRGEVSAIIVNSGNANASTGKPGEDNAKSMCAAVAEGLSESNITALRKLNLKPSDVLVGSTGIIGRPLPMEKIERGIAHLITRLDRGPAADAAAARGIMTTDLTPKSALRTFKLAGKTVHLGGICKGSGMIAPNMGTMLVYITTDAAISSQMLRTAVRKASDASFNRISVDQHTSPSDMVLMLANGAAGNRSISRQDKNYAQFLDVLTDLCRDMAYQVVKDGEGATRVFRVQVTGARSEREADLVAKAVVNSPLVKTAVHGADPNWGRIVTAAGYSGVAVQPAKMSLYVGGRDGVCVFERGTPTDANKKKLRPLHRLMSKKEVTFTLDLGRGKASVEWLGCDLSRQYIAINADYST